MDMHRVGMQPRLLGAGFAMPRVPRRRQWTEAACYHVMNRGHNREVVFADDDDRGHFLALLARYQQCFPWRLYHYCLMSNHFHLLLQLADPKKLSSLLAGLLRSYVHYYNRRYGFCGHLWQGRFNKAPTIFQGAPDGRLTKGGGLTR